MQLPNVSYQIGYRFEHYVRKKLEKAGFHCERGSSRFPDLLVVAPLSKLASLTDRGVFFVECKFHPNDFSLEERKALLKLAQVYGGTAILATHDKTGRDRWTKGHKTRIGRRVAFYQVTHTNPIEPDLEVHLAIHGAE